MLPLSSAAIIEKNKVAGDSVWVILLEITIPGASAIRICSNNENIVWNGETWVPFPFELDEMSENNGGEVPSLNVRVSNVTQELQYYLEETDGAVGFPVTIRVVNSKHLDLTSPELQLDFVCNDASYDARWITFKLGGDQKTNRRVPERRYLKNFCPFAYGGIECGIPAATKAAYPTCVKTLAQCRERGNSQRYGGEPALPLGSFYG